MTVENVLTLAPWSGSMFYSNTQSRTGQWTLGFIHAWLGTNDQERKEGRKGPLHPAPTLSHYPDIIPSGNLLTQAPCEPPHPQSYSQQGFPCVAIRVKARGESGPRNPAKG